MEVGDIVIKKNAVMKCGEYPYTRGVIKGVGEKWEKKILQSHILPLAERSADPRMVM